MTSYENSNGFLLGLVLLAKYRLDDFTVNVIETSTISINGLRSVSKEDMEDLKLFGWNVGKDKDGGSWAEFFKLEYVDT